MVCIGRVGSVRSVNRIQVDALRFVGFVGTSLSCKFLLNEPLNPIQCTLPAGDTFQELSCMLAPNCGRQCSGFFVVGFEGCYVPYFGVPEMLWASGAASKT